MLYYTWIAPLFIDLVEYIFFYFFPIFQQFVYENEKRMRGKFHPNILASFILSILTHITDIVHKHHILYRKKTLDDGSCS